MHGLAMFIGCPRRACLPADRLPPYLLPLRRCIGALQELIDKETLTGTQIKDLLLRVKKGGGGKDAVAAAAG